MKYTCKCCESLTIADDFETIVALEKLCVVCHNLSDVDRVAVRKKVYDQKHTFDNSIKIKSYQKHYHKPKPVMVWTCNSCGEVFPYNFKPFDCEYCMSRSFTGRPK